MPEIEDEAALARAFAYFKRISAPLFMVRPRHYVYRAHGGAWISVSAAQLIEFVRDENEDRVLAIERGWIQMPAWWSYDFPYAVRDANDRIVNKYRSRGEAMRFAMLTVENGGEKPTIITVNVETGEECPA